MRQKILLSLFLAVCFASSAASERVGIAIVQAPEKGSSACAGQKPDVAFACARAKCEKQGVKARDCVRTNWCFPSGWSADVLLLHNEGVEWHEVTCGWPNQKAALDAASILCDPTSRDFIVNCKVVQIFDANGKPQLK